MSARRFVSLAVFMALVAVAAFTGSRFAPGNWYQALAKPSWTPPGWLFGPIWTLLYLAIAVAGWLAWRESAGRLSLPLGFWGAQLILNAVWSWLFFGLHAPGAALVDILLLLAAIGGFAVVVASPTARMLFGLYGAWVAFATALNFAIWRLN